MLTWMTDISAQHTLRPTSLYYGVPVSVRVKISQNMVICLIFLSESLLYEFWILLPVAEVPTFVCLPLQHDCSERTEEWTLHFARKCLTRKWHIKCGKLTQALWLAHTFKMQKPIGCGTTTTKYQLLTDSLPPPRHMHAYAWKWQFY